MGLEMVKLFLYSYLAFQNVVRNRKKTLTSGLGIMLAIMIIFSNSLAVTLQARAIVATEMEKLDYHLNFSYSIYSEHSMNVSGYDQFMEQIDDIENIERYDLSYSFNPGSRYNNYTGLALGEPDSETYRGPHTIGISRAKGAESSVTPAIGTVTLYNTTAEANGLAVGDRINVTSILYSSIRINFLKHFITIHQEHANLSLIVGEIISHPYYFHYYSYDYNITRGEDSWNGSYPYNEMVFLNPRDLIYLMSDLDINYDLRFYYKGWLDEAVYTEHGLAKAKDLARKATIEVFSVYYSQEHDYRFSTPPDYWYAIEAQPYHSAFRGVEEQQMETRLFALALSIPLVLIGIYIGYLGVELFIRGRRREMGLLKVRGATSRQISYMLNMESVIIGGIAGFIGLILAIFSVKVFMRYTQAASYLARIPWYETGLTPGIVITAMTLGALFLFLSFVRSLHRLSKLEIAELLANYSRSEDRARYKIRYDLGLLITAIFFLCLLPFLDGLDSLSYRADNFFIEILSEFLWLLTPMMVVVSPYIFIFTMVRLATRASTRPYVWVATKIKRISGSLNYIVQKNISNGERRIFKVTNVLSITIAFLVLTSTFYYSMQGKEEALIRSEVGGDVSFEIYASLDYENTSLFQHRLHNISGVKSSSVIQSRESILVEDQNILIEQEYGWDEIVGRDVQLKVIDAKNYSELAYIDARLWKEGDDDSFSELNGRSDRAVISIGLARYLGLKVGESFEIYRQYSHEIQVQINDTTNETILIKQEIPLGTIKVTGIIKSLPGMFDNDIEYSFMEEEYYAKRMLFMDRTGYKTLMDEFYQQYPMFYKTEQFSPHFLLENDDDIDHESLMSDLEEHLDANGYSYGTIRSAELELTKIHSEPTSDSLLLILRTQLAVMVFLSMLVAMIIVYMASLERESEMANIQLKGTTRKQVFQLQVGETVTILVYSIIIGIITGILAAMAWIFTFNVYEGVQIIRYRYFPSPYQLPALGIMAALVLLVSYGVTKMYIKTDLAKVIKLRGG